MMQALRNSPQRNLRAPNAQPASLTTKHQLDQE